MLYIINKEKHFFKLNDFQFKHMGQLGENFFLNVVYSDIDLQNE